ncbi:MAG TPA: exopolysaccharide transport family protein [Rhizomicrobium sp.]
MTSGNLDEFRLSDLARIAQARMRLVVVTMFAVVALAAIAVLLIPQRYSATSVVLLDPRKNNVADISAVVSELPVDPASVADQIQILNSRDLAGRVIDRLGLADDPDFNPALAPGFFANDLSPEQQRNAEIDALRKHMTVETVGLSTAMEITYSARDPEKAARIANAISDIYISTEMDAKLNATTATTDWLQSRIKQLSHQVQAAEANVQAYKAEHNINETADGTSLLDQQLTAINTQLVEAKSDLAEKQANQGRIDSLMKNGHANDVSQVVASPLIVQLREQQAEVIRSQADLATRYGPKHPKLIAAQNQERDLQAKIDQETDRIAGSVGNDVSVARAHVGSLQSSLRNVEAESTDQNMARVRLKALEANAASTRSMYEAFVVRLRETQSPIGVPDARVISHASAPSAPSWPPRLLIMAASVPAGLLLGLLLALLAERFGGAPATRPVRNPALDRLRAVPVLGELQGASARAADDVIERPGAPFSRGIAAVAQRLANGPKVVAVTDAPVVTAALARAASAMGSRVVVIDGNLTMPSAARSLNLTLGRTGLMEVLGGKAPLSAALQRDPRSQALVLSPAWRAQDPVQVLASRQMGELIAHLRRSCDLVLIDAPASEARMLAHLADAVALVVPENGTTPEAVMATVDSLGAPVGLILAR